MSFLRKVNLRQKVNGDEFFFKFFSLLVVELAVLVSFLKDHRNKSEQCKVELHL